MKKRNAYLATMSTLAVLFGVTQLNGCGTTEDDAVGNDSNLAALQACNLDDGTVDHHAQLRACDPLDGKKTTICHVPPGNPANAHTICVGNAAVPAHMSHHGDKMGACAVETVCPPPPPATGTGSGGSDVPAVGGRGGGAMGAGGSSVVIVGGADVIF